METFPCYSVANKDVDLSSDVTSLSVDLSSGVTSSSVELSSGEMSSSELDELEFQL